MPLRFVPCNFYPRPPRGGRPYTARTGCGVIEFLSTPSARRATVHLEPQESPLLDFYPRPPRGGRRSTSKVNRSVNHISIHALREEGDVLARVAHCFAWLFLSTPSARRATGVARLALVCSDMISIHALREEGDPATSASSCWRRHFYPRPPRGGRPSRRRSSSPGRKISIHALREEGDRRKS